MKIVPAYMPVSYPFDALSSPVSMSSVEFSNLSLHLKSTRLMGTPNFGTVKRRHAMHNLDRTEIGYRDTPCTTNLDSKLMNVFKENKLIHFSTWCVFVTSTKFTPNCTKLKIFIFRKTFYRLRLSIWDKGADFVRKLLGDR